MSRSKLYLYGVRILAHIQQPGRAVPLPQYPEPAALAYLVPAVVLESRPYPRREPWYARVFRWLWRAFGGSGSRSW